MSMPNDHHDARRKPRRGVRVRPLPRHCHEPFRAFCAELRTYCQSHYSTWRLAAGQYPDNHVQANAVYWRSALKFINDIEYLGVRRGTDR